MIKKRKRYKKKKKWLKRNEEKRIEKSDHGVRVGENDHRRPIIRVICRIIKTSLGKKNAVESEREGKRGKAMISMRIAEPSVIS